MRTRLWLNVWIPAADRASVYRCVWKQHNKNKTWAGERERERETVMPRRHLTYLIPLFWLSPLDGSSDESITSKSEALMDQPRTAASN